MQLDLRDVVRHGDGLVSATLVHMLAGQMAEQNFTARVLDDTQLASAFHDAGLVLDRVSLPTNAGSALTSPPERKQDKSVPR
ncbi:MAG: hypothetical protein M3Y49_19040 [Actinomycetota bacterium]|nr:hypothetical protein [Actinomycetota bacterium]